MGVAPEQSPSATHCAQLLAVVSQTVLPAVVQVVLSVHSTQVPDVALHAGRLLLFAAQPPWGAVPSLQATHLCPVLHIGLPAATLQSPWTLHSTHLLALGSHTGFALLVVQSVLAAHSTHAPVAEQTGSALFLPKQPPGRASKSPQPTQVCCVLQRGVVRPSQSTWLLQATHALVTGSHTPVSPPSKPKAQSLLAVH
jgi:hypothetical protein